MEHDKETKKNKWGGVREGAGRPKGSGNKVTASDLLLAAERALGRPFVDSLVEGYTRSITENNNKLRVMYEKMIIDKVIADRQQVEVVESEDAVEAKKAAFADAIGKLTGLNTDAK